VTLEEYRIQFIEKLKACRDPANVRGLLAEVDLVLMKSGISDRVQRTFWETLNNSLDVVAQESTLLLEKQAATALSAVIAAAQTVIAQYLVLLANDQQSPGS
jgi:hypothetical protein